MKSEQIRYSHAETTMHGYLAWDEQQEGRRPGVLVVHEWWGQNDYIRGRADMLAELGYTALAVDMFGKCAQADEPERAGELAGAVLGHPQTAKARFEAAMQVLHAHPTVDSSRTAAIGYCFGGSVVLHMVRLGVPLNAVASFHGGLGTEVPAGIGDSLARVVAYNGADDPFVSDEDISSFLAEMQSAGIDYQFINYPGCVHAFTNPAATAEGERLDLPVRYNALADQSSWAHMRLLLEDVFRQ